VHLHNSVNYLLHRRCWSSGLDPYADTNVSEEHTVFIFNAEVEPVCFSKTLVSNYRSTRHCNAEDQPRHLHRRDSLKSRCLLYKCFCRISHRTFITTTMSSGKAYTRQICYLDCCFKHEYTLIFFRLRGEADSRGLKCCHSP
jgi:hypothetical protein